MAISESDLPKIEEIFLEQARAHFPPEVEFMEANASLYTSLCGEEWLRVVLLYDAPGPAPGRRPDVHLPQAHRPAHAPSGLHPTVLGRLRQHQGSNPAETGKGNRHAVTRKN